jgi:cytochrome c biogenesis protein CcmG/thiol:disulfide interchange protein DsbE
MWDGFTLDSALKRLLAPVPIAAIAVTFALLALLAYGVAQNEPDNSIDSAVAHGKRPAAPALNLPTLDGGGTLSLASLRGKVVVLNFWASWCGPCRDETPLLERWQRRLAPRGATVLGVNVRDLTSDARAFARRYGITYPIVRDGGGTHTSDFGVQLYPDTLLIDRRGRIAATVRGPVSDTYLKRVLPALLREPA